MTNTDKFGNGRRILNGFVKMQAKCAPRGTRETASVSAVATHHVFDLGAGQGTDDLIDGLAIFEEHQRRN